MLLLGLPLEMLERIIGHLVTGAGSVEGWKHRKVCRTFRRSIEFETLAKQPTRAFLHGKGESATKILKANTALYLSYRIMAEEKAYPFPPRFLKKICDAISAQLPVNDHKTRWQYARVLCRLLVERKGSQIQRLLTAKNPEKSNRSHFTSNVGKFSDGRTSDIVAAAAAVGDLGALRLALGKTPFEVFNESPAFGFPLIAAVSRNHFEIVSAIVKHVEQTPSENYVYLNEVQFQRAVGIALRSTNTEMALLLLKVFHAYGLSASKAEYEDWISRAMDKSDSRVIRQVQTLRQTGVASAWTAFAKACRSGDLVALRMFIEEGFVTLYGTEPVYLGKSALSTAVSSGGLEAVEEILKLGANPNGMPHEYESPLQIAVLDIKQKIVRLLLQHGAHPDAVLGAWKKRDHAYRYARSDIEVLLIEASKKQEFYECPIEPITQFAADAPDLVLPEVPEEADT